MAMKDVHLSHRQSVACNCKRWRDLLSALTLFKSFSPFAIGRIIYEVLAVKTVCCDRQGGDWRGSSVATTFHILRNSAYSSTLPADDLAKLGSSIQTVLFSF
jgi:hypothetical protein